MTDVKEREIARQSIDTQAARLLATTTKTVPQMVGVTPRWLLRLLPWVSVESGTYRVNRRRATPREGRRVHVDVQDGHARVTARDLAAVPLLRGLDPKVLEHLAGRFVTERHPAGKVFLQEGDPAEKFFLVARGKVEAFTMGPHGEKVRLGLLSDGDYFGEMALIRHSPRMASGRALTNLTLLALPKGDFEELMAKAPVVRSELERAVEERLATLERVNEYGEEAIDAGSSQEGEPELPEIFVDYETEPREYALHCLETVVRVHTRISDIYNKPINQMKEQIRLAIEGLKEKQEWEVLNNPAFGLLPSVDPAMRVVTRAGPPTPDDMDELIARVWKKPAYFLAHPRAVAAFGRECTRRGVPPPTVQMFGTPFLTWRGIPVVPCDKIEVADRGGARGTTSVLLMRVGEAEQGVVGLHQTGIPGEQMPSLSVRFMGINRKAVASYLVALYFSAAVLTPDALGALENVQVGYYHEYA